MLRAKPVVSSLLTNVLTHRMTMRLKRPLRDQWWALRGAGLTNPPFPSSVQSILFVCLGNICRSPFAARRAEMRFAQAGNHRIRCASCGLRPSQATRPPSEACEVAAAYGVSLDNHAPQPLTSELMLADLIVVMDALQLQWVREAFPNHQNRLFLLSLLDADGRGAYERCNIADPFGQALPAYADCYGRIDRALDKLVSTIQPPSTTSC